MPRVKKILKILFILLLVAVASSCSSTRKNTFYQKRKKASHINTEQLGRNRYFFSNGYQKKLSSTYRRKK